MTSHELNLFCYVKDKAYFDKVVRPFIACKIEKQFIDYYLLGMIDYAAAHAHLAKLGHLNALEKCLLVEVLVKLQRQDEANAIVRLLKDESERNFKMDPNVQNRLFDIVLSLNALKSHGELEDLDGFLQSEARYEAERGVRERDDVMMMSNMIANLHHLLVCLPHLTTTLPP